MELWVSGFNAWGQLDFRCEPLREAHDISLPICVLRDQRIEILRTTLTTTIVNTSSGHKVAGSPDDLAQICLDKGDGLPSIAIAGNDKVAEIKGSNIIEYKSISIYTDSLGDSLGELEDFVQIAANEVTFTALSKAGKVWTWGDGRYEACLGREVSEECPANLPCIVDDLLDLPTGPIRKISSGGYATAAITSGNDLYVWGSGGRPGQPKLLLQMSGAPEPVDLEGDILDVSVGVDHMIALTTEHKLYVVGANGNGQLGLDVEKLSEWKEVALPLKENQRITGVHAGYKNSIVIVENIT